VYWGLKGAWDSGVYLSQFCRLFPLFFLSALTLISGASRTGLRNAGSSGFASEEGKFVVASPEAAAPVSGQCKNVIAGL